ncbi:MAG: cupin domain-containing protein, partial [Taibaiella sp.]|nr:cupin domain-containing protein [Taibaiella sp.]
MFNTSCFDLSSTSHFHKEIEFIHILSGKMTFIINGRKISVSKGNILFVNSMVVHSSEGAAGDKSKMHLLQFDPGIIYSTSLFSEYKYLFPFMNHNTLACYLFNTWENKGYKLLSALLHKINMEFEGKNIAYEICIKSLLYRILTILYRNGILDFCFIKNLYYDREKFL